MSPRARTHTRKLRHTVLVFALGGLGCADSNDGDSSDSVGGTENPAEQASSTVAGDSTTGTADATTGTNTQSETGAGGSTTANSEATGTSNSGSTTSATSATSTGADTSADSTAATETNTGSETSADVGETSDSGMVDDPLPDSEVGVWQWVDIGGSSCSKGSQAGLGLRRGTENKLVIYFEGGNACFNRATCAEFVTKSSISDDDKLGKFKGILNADAADNPVRNWHHIDIPYCSGDIHAGAAPNGGQANGTTDRQYTGRANVAAFLARIGPTFPDLEQILVVGTSAGGFGALTNFSQISRAFAQTPVTMIDDSGIPLDDEAIAPCLQQRFRETWQLESSFLAECPACNEDPEGGGLWHYLPHIAQSFPDAQLGIVSSAGDEYMRTFWGYGSEDCQDIDSFGFPSAIPEQTHVDALDRLRAELRKSKNWGSFTVPGTEHGFLANDDMYSTAVDGINLTDWLADMLAGQATHVLADR